MKHLSIPLALCLLWATTGCSQIVTLEPAEISKEEEIENVTLRTSTGEVYYFESATVRADSLVGHAQETRTVFLEGGAVSEMTLDRTVSLGFDQIEQMQTRRTDWKRVGLVVLGVVALAAAIAIVAAETSDDSGQEGGGSGGGKPPPVTAPLPGAQP